MLSAIPYSSKPIPPVLCVTVKKTQPKLQSKSEEDELLEDIVLTIEEMLEETIPDLRIFSRHWFPSMRFFRIRRLCRQITRECNRALGMVADKRCNAKVLMRRLEALYEEAENEFRCRY